MFMYSERPKSELFRFSDVQLLAQFQTVRHSDNVRNPNDFIGLHTKISVQKRNVHKGKWKLGPASAVEDRPPTNPVIEVRSSSR